MLINPKIFKAYDIRSRYPEELDLEGAIKVLQATVHYFSKYFGVQKRLKLNIGHDMRSESILLYQEVQRALGNYAIDVNLLGNIPTTSGYYGVFALEADAGIQITSSHNPAGYLGMKPFLRQEKAIVKISGLALRDFLDQMDQTETPLGEATFSLFDNVVADEVKNSVTNYFLHPKKFRIGVDTANGMGIKIWQELEKLVPLEIHYLHSELDGSFPNHLSDTLQHQYWTKLQDLIREKNLDLGVATDGDGDRIAVIDERGEFVNNSLLTCILIKSLHETKNISSAQVDIRSVLNVKNLCEKLGISLTIGNVGHALITKAMNDKQIDFSGESSGHYFFKQTGGAESIVDVITLLLEELSSSGKSLSTLVQVMQSSHEIVETNFKMPPDLKNTEIFAKLKDIEPNAQVSTLDGITFDYPTWRYNVRTSNTEPLLRLNLEGVDANETKQQTQRIINFLQSLGCVLASGH